MKNIFTVIFFAAFLFLSTGCGDVSAVDDVKKSAETAVENKVDEVKKDAASKVADVANEVGKKATEIATDDKVNFNSAKDFSLGGISPGMTLAEVKDILGEPVSHHDDDEFSFANGLLVEFDDHKHIVKEIKTKLEGVFSAGGIGIGMTEQKLLEIFGNPERKDFDDGATEYKYFSGDRTKKIVFKVYNGKISEIKCELDD